MTSSKRLTELVEVDDEYEWIRVKKMKNLTELTLEEFATTYKNWQGRKRAEKQRARRELREAGELALLGDRHGAREPALERREAEG